MENKITKKYVDGIAMYFETKKKDNERVLITYNRLLNFLNCSQITTGKKILDLGSGDGSFVNVCKENNIDAFALDAYSQKINFENDKLPYDFSPEMNINGKSDTELAPQKKFSPKTE